MRYVKLNATDISVTAAVVDDSGLPVTGLTNSTFPTVKYRKGRAAAVTVSLSALSGITDAHSDGGVIESGEGRYRLDLPDAVATSLDTVEIFGEATDKRLIVEKLQVVAFDPESATSLGLSNLDAAVSSRSTYAGSDTAGTTTLLSRLTSTRAGYLDNISAAPPTSAAIATAVHQYDYSSTGDAEKFIGYIQATFSAASNVDTRLTATRAGYLDGLNVASLSTRLGTLPTTGTVMTTADYTAPLDAAATRAALGLSSANLDTQLAAIVADTNELQTDWADGGRLDLLLDAAGAAGDPWSTSLPGAYSAGTAGYIVGTNLNATVSSRLSSLGTNAPAGWINAAAIGSEAITSAKFAEGAITEGAIDTAALTTAKFDTAFLTSGLIAAGAFNGKGDWNTVAPDNSTVSTINSKLGTPAASVSADIAAVKSDTGTLVGRITANLFSGITYLSRWLGVVAGKTADSTTLAEINATTGGTSYDNTTDSLQAIKDAGVSVDVDEAAIAAAVVTGIGGTTIEVKSPVLAGGDLELLAGDAYDLEIPITGWTGDNLDGAAVTLRLVSIADYKASGTSATPEMEVTGLAAQAGSTVTCSWTLSTTNTNTATQTSVYPVQQTRTHRYTIRVDADDLTVAEGRAVVRANPT